jgi:TRAP-type mannitol/chloroaromatic compound transport system permease large subunit
VNRLSRALVAVLASVAFASMADAQQARPSAPSASQITQAFGYDEVSKPGDAAALETPSTPPQGGAVTANPVSDSEEEVRLTHEFRMSQQHDKLRFAILLAVTALLSHLIVLWFLPRAHASTQVLTTSVVSATGLIYIVFGTIILVVIATTEAQLTAAMGILGAVAGYLFGRMRRDENEEQERPSPKTDAPHPRTDIPA